MDKYVYVVWRADRLDFGSEDIMIVTQTRREAEEYIKSADKLSDYNISEVPFKHHN